MGDNAGVDADHIESIFNRSLPPGIFDGLAQGNPDRPVVEKTGETTVNLATRINEAAAFAEVHQFVHHVFHSLSPKMLTSARRSIRQWYRPWVPTNPSSD